MYWICAWACCNLTCKVLAAIEHALSTPSCMLQWRWLLQGLRRSTSSHGDLSDLDACMSGHDRPLGHCCISTLLDFLVSTAVTWQRQAWIYICTVPARGWCDDPSSAMIGGWNIAGSLIRAVCLNLFIQEKLWFAEGAKHWYCAKWMLMLHWQVGANWMLLHAQCICMHLQSIWPLMCQICMGFSPNEMADWSSWLNCDAWDVYNSNGFRSSTHWEVWRVHIFDFRSNCLDPDQLHLPPSRQSADHAGKPKAIDKLKGSEYCHTDAGAYQI